MTKINSIDQLGENYLKASGKKIQTQPFRTTQELGMYLLKRLKADSSFPYYHFELGADEGTASGITEIVEFEVDYKDLLDLVSLGLAEKVTVFGDGCEEWNVQGLMFKVDKAKLVEVPV